MLSNLPASDLTDNVANKEALKQQLIQVLNRCADQSLGEGEIWKSYQARQKQISFYRTEAFLDQMKNESVAIQGTGFFQKYG